MQTRKALKRLSNGNANYTDRVTSNGPLSQNSEWLLEKHANSQQRIQSERERHETAASMPMLEVARKKLAEVISNDILPDDTPIAMRFDVFNVIKQAVKSNPKDSGLKLFATHLERLWHKDALGTITAGALTKLRDHYQTQNPRSVVGEITDTMVPKVAFNNLPVAQLTRIASEIDSQEDYDIAIVRHGLHRENIRNVRARAFIRELVERKASVGKLQDEEASIGTAKRSRAGDIGKRVMNRIAREGQLNTDVNQEDLSAEKTASIDFASFNNTEMVYTAEFAKKEWSEMMNHLASTGEGLPKTAGKDAVSPSGWEGTVEEMKECSDIKSPHALAWYMEGKGYKPSAAAKGSSDSSACMEPDVNDQQPAQVSVPDDGAAALTKSKSKKADYEIIGDFAVKANHPLVDDNQDHFPVFSEDQYKAASTMLNDLKDAPDWWLGSTKELIKTVQAAVVKKEAGDLPPEFKENMKKKKEEGSKEDDKDDKDDDYKEASRFSSAEIESALLEGELFKVGKYAIYLATDNGVELVKLSSKQGSRGYPLAEMDGAIADFIYLAKNEKLTTSPSPTFVVREGFRMQCSACMETNSFPMPKEASDVNCPSCNTMYPSKVVNAAFNVKVAQEETTLIVFTPSSLQDEFGDKFAKAAEMMGADAVGADGSRAEAYAVHPGNEKMAEIWDFMIKSGFKPLAQYYGMDAPQMNDVLGQDEMPPMDMGDMPMPEMDDEDPMMDSLEDPMMDAPSDVPNLGEPGGDAEWADHQMAQAAMMHYKAQGNSVTEAVTQFTKDYGDGYDPETVMQVAAQVYNLSFDQVKIGMLKEAGDLPSTEVNHQQPDTVKVESQPLGSGEESDTKGELPSTKVNTQAKPQGTMSDKSMGHGDDTKETIPSPGKPKAMHPPGVPMSPTDGSGGGLGSGDLSDNAVSKTTRKWDSESAAAPNNMRSAKHNLSMFGAQV